jgi:hypothetical protein
LLKVIMLALRTADTLIAVVVMAGFGLIAATAALSVGRRSFATMWTMVAVVLAQHGQGQRVVPLAALE